MWAESIDQRTGRTYYYHVLTSERTYERPLHQYDKKLAEDHPSTSTDYNNNSASNGTVTTSSMSNSGDKLTLRDQQQQQKRQKRQGCHPSNKSAAPRLGVAEWATKCGPVAWPCACR